MNNIEFSQVLVNNIPLYIISLCFSIAIYYFFLRKYYNSILDPMFLTILISAIASAIPIYLYLIGYCKFKYLIYFFFAKVAFWLGFSLNYSSNNSFKTYRIYNEEKISYKLYLSFYVISIVLKLVSYIILGIPLLLNNRQDLYINANGLALIDKIAYPLSFYCLVYSFYSYKKKPILAKSYIIYSIITGILSGGKGFILNICTAYFIYKTIYKEEKITIPTHYLIIILISPLLILIISGFSSDFYIALYDYVFRIVAYGDVYWYSFPNNTIEQIQVENPIRHLFSGILGPLRLINYETDGIPIGRLLYWETMPIEYYNTMGGPNARPVVLAYILFKNFGIFICYIFGIVMAFFMTHIKRYLPKGIISTIIVGFIYVYFKNIATDPVMAFNGFFSTLLFIFILLFFLFLIQRKYTFKRIKYNENKLCSIHYTKHIAIIILSLFFLTTSILMTIYN